MRKILFVPVLFLLAATATSCKTSYFTAKDRKNVNKVVEWQMQHFTDSVAPQTGWVNAALYRGMVEWADITRSGKIYDFLLRIGEAHSWNMLDRVYDADDLCIGQTYFRLYDRQKDYSMIKQVAQRVDYVMAHPDTAALITAGGKYYRNRWGWCDALFMAPPVYARLYQQTGDRKYLDFCFSEYKVTTDSLYDRQKHLFYRDLRLVNNRNSKGEKIFWGRGNGWVYAGLALLLETVPKTDASYQYYLNLYHEMTGAIVGCQDKGGAWHTSLLDTEAYPQPENSAAGFFVFGLSWGLNKGVISGEVNRQAALSGWKALQKHIDRDGKLGYVQPVGHAPQEIGPDMTAPYGVGAYLLAASEIWKMNNRE